MLARAVDAGDHAGTDAKIGVDDGRLCDGVPGEARLDAQSALGGDGIVQHARLGKEQMRGDRRVAAFEAVLQTAAGVGDVPFDVAAIRAFEDDKAHFTRSAAMASKVRSSPSRRAA